MKNKLQNMALPQKCAAALLAGALMSLAMPPLGFFPVLLLCVPAFIWLAQSCERKCDSFLTGWAFGAGYFIAGLYWVSAALFVDIQQWWWVLPLSLIVAPCLYALCYGLIPLIARYWRKDDQAYVLIFIAAWGLIEFARGHLFTGFPWNLVGYGWDRALAMLQISSVIGIYGLTLLTIFWAAAPAFAKNRMLLGLALSSFILVLSFGFVRLHQNPTLQNENYTLRLVQPNIPQSQKWVEAEAWRNFQNYLNLSAAPAESTPTFVIWPETAVASDLATSPDIAASIAISLPQQSVGILGSLRMTSSPPQFFNSVSVIDKQARIIGTYDKHHLVPFGEYIPFRNHLKITPIANAISGIGDFTRGSGPQTIQAAGLPSFSPLICYEVIFPGAVIDRAHRPEWLVNVTNDGWYGKSAGPYQHLAISRLRSIEEGLPLARAANTGISAVVDPLGRIVASKDLGEAGIVDAILPKALPETLYSRFGEKIFFALLALFGLAALLRKTL
jgi:apolipoprotein N-acyltransferase